MANLLTNPNFGLPPAAPTLLIGTDHAGISAAPDWTTWNNYGPSANVCAYTSTAIIKLAAPTVNQQLPTPQPQCLGIFNFLNPPPGTEQVIEVCTNGKSNGIVQVFGAINTGPAHTQSSVWVFVLSGQAAMGTGNGGNTKLDVVSAKTYQWEQLQAPNGVSPANEFIVYSASGDGAWFFVANASVVAVD